MAGSWLLDETEILTDSKYLEVEAGGRAVTNDFINAFSFGT